MRKYIFLIALLLFAGTAAADTVIITKSTVVEATPTIGTSAYADGDQLGSKMSLVGAVDPNIRSGLISSVEIIDLDAEEVAIDVVFFDTDFTAGTDNAAFDVSDTDILNIVCVVNITTYDSFNDNSLSIVENANCPFKLPAGSTTLYAMLVSRGTPTYTAASDLTLRVGILQD